MEPETNDSSKTSSQDKVTIIIPVYNVAAYIEPSLLSAFNQTYKNIEYLIIDDKGTDNSIAIARSIIENHPRKNDIRIIEHEKNRGAGAAKNTGIEYSTGKYIFFIDSDDKLTPDAIEKLYDAIKRTDADFSIGSYESVDQANTGKKWEWKFADCTIKGDCAVADYFFDGGFYVMTWNKLYKRSFLSQNKIICIEGSLYDDQFFALQVALNAKEVTTIHDVTYYYVFREGSSMSKLKERYFRDYYNLIEIMITYSKGFKNKSIYKRIVYHIYGFKFSTLERLQKDGALSLEFKKEYFRKLSSKFLSLKEIWLLKNAKTIHKIKYSISFLPYKIQLIILRLINSLYKK